MKKFINDPANITDELLEGFALSQPELIRLEKKRIIVNTALDKADRVTIVAIGGSGHEPAISGYVGEGMIDVSVVGEIFTAPGSRLTVEAIRLADRGKGVLLLVLNHAGDLLSGELAMKECSSLGLSVEMVVTNDDISNAPRSMSKDRRGLVGCVPLYKIAGAAAAEGKSLKEVADIARHFADQMATLAVGVRGATNPVNGTLLAEFEEDDMEIGMGQHGEEGGGRQKLLTADATAEIMLRALTRDLHIQKGEKVMLLLDGTGATTLMELFIIYRACWRYLREQGIEIAASKVGELLTVQEAAGFQMFLARMDDELLRLWKKPCNTPYFKCLT